MDRQYFYIECPYQGPVKAHSITYITSGVSKKYLDRDSTEKLLHAFVTSRLDYCNGFLTSKLQRVQNAAARLLYRAPRYCHITPLLRELHWLPVRSRIDYKTLIITFKAIYGTAPKYIGFSDFKT